MINCLHLNIQISSRLLQELEDRGNLYCWNSIWIIYFIVDSGLRNQAVSYKEGNNGNRFENIVFLELARRWYTIDVVRLDDKEIDFIARKNQSIEYYQVTYQLPANSHETDNLLMIKDNFKKFVIIGRYEGVDNINGIAIKYIVDWLLEN